MKRRRRFSYQGMYFADTRGLRAAVLDLHQLSGWLQSLLGERGLLDEELVPQRGESSRNPEPRVTVREALAAFQSVAYVLSDCASVVERVWQAREQVEVMLSAAEASEGDWSVSWWIVVHDLCARIAADESPVGRETLAAARARLRAAKRGSAKARVSDGKGAQR